MERYRVKDEQDPVKRKNLKELREFLLDRYEKQLETGADLVESVLERISGLTSENADDESETNSITSYDSNLSHVSVDSHAEVSSLTGEIGGSPTKDDDFCILDDVNLTKNVLDIQDKLPQIKTALKLFPTVNFPIHNLRDRPFLICEHRSKEGKIFKSNLLIDSGSQRTIVSRQYLKARRDITGEKFPLVPTTVRLTGHGGHDIRLQGEVILSFEIRDVNNRLYQLRHIRALVTEGEKEVTDMDKFCPILGMRALSIRMARMSMDSFLLGKSPSLPVRTPASLFLPDEFVTNQDHYKNMLLGENPSLRKFDVVVDHDQPLRPRKRGILRLKAEVPDNANATASIQSEEELEAHCQIMLPGHEPSEFLTTFQNGYAYMEVVNETNATLNLDGLTIGSGAEFSQDQAMRTIKSEPIVEAVAALDTLKYITEDARCICHDRYARNATLVFDMNIHGYSSIPLKRPNASARDMRMKNIVYSRGPNNGHEIFINLQRKVNAKRIKTILKGVNNTSIYVVLPPKMYSLAQARQMAHFVEVARGQNFHVQIVHFKRFCSDHQLPRLPASNRGWVNVRWKSTDAEKRGGSMKKDEILLYNSFDECELLAGSEGGYMKAEFLIPSKYLMYKEHVQDKLKNLMHKLRCADIQYPLVFSAPQYASHFMIQQELPRIVARAGLSFDKMESLPTEFIPPSIAFWDAHDNTGKYVESEVGAVNAIQDLDADLAAVMAFENLARSPDWSFGPFSASEDKNMREVLRVGAKYEKELLDNEKFQDWIKVQAAEISDDTPGFEAGVEYPDSERDTIEVDKVEIPIPTKRVPDVPWRETGVKIPEHLDKEGVKFYENLFDRYNKVVDESTYIDPLNITPVEYEFETTPTSFHLQYPIRKDLAEFVTIIFQRFVESGIFSEIPAPPKNVALPCFVILKHSKLKGFNKEEIRQLIAENPEMYLRCLVDARHLSKHLAPRYETLPKIDEILLSLGEFKYLTSLDANNFYFRIPLGEKSQEYTVIALMGRYFKMKRVLQGAASSVEIATQLMEKIRCKIDRNHVFTYIDDIFIGANDEVHLRELTEKFFHEANEIGLKLVLSKMQLEVKETANVLGYHLHWDEDRKVSYEPTLNKKEVFPLHKTHASKNEVWTLCGVAQWLINFTKPSLPIFCTPVFGLLSRLAHVDRNQKVELTELERLSWKLMVHHIKTVTPLHLPRREARLTILSDAGVSGMGTVFLAKYDDEEEYRMVAMYSKAFTKAQIDSSAYAREFIGLTASILKFKKLIYHCRSTIAIVDCISVVYAVLHSQKYTRSAPFSSVPGRYLLALASFTQISFQHMPRAYLHLPDTLNKFGLDERILQCQHIHLAHLHQLRHGMLRSPLETGQVYSLDEISNMVQQGLETGFEFIQPFVPEEDQSGLSMPPCDHPSICGSGEKYPSCFNKCEEIQKQHRAKMQEKYEPKIVSEPEASDGETTGDEGAPAVEAAECIECEYCEALSSRSQSIDMSDEMMWEDLDEYTCSDFDTADDEKARRQSAIDPGEKMNALLDEIAVKSELGFNEYEIQEAKTSKVESLLEEALVDDVSVRDDLPMALKSPLEKLTLKRILAAQLQDPFYADIIDTLQGKKANPNEIKKRKYKKYVLLGGTLLAQRPMPKRTRPPVAAKVIIPPPLNLEAVVLAHVMYAHTGMGRLRAILRRAFFIPKLDAMSKIVCRSCPYCLKWKRLPITHGIIGNIFSEAPMHTVFLDFAVFRRTIVRGRKFKYILVFTDARSNYIVAMPTSSMLSSVVLRKVALMLSLFPIRQLISDRGSSLVRHPAVQQLCREFNCEPIVLRPYSHRGMLSEGSIRLVRRMIRLLKEHTGKSSWADQLPELAAMILNTTPRQVRGYRVLVTPEDMVFRQASDPVYDAWRMAKIPSEKIDRAKAATMELLDAYLEERRVMKEEIQQKKIELSRIQKGTIVQVFRDKEKPRDKFRSDYLDKLYKVVERRSHLVKLRSLQDNEIIEKNIDWVVPVGTFPRALYESLDEAVKRYWKPLITEDVISARGGDRSSGQSNQGPAFRVRSSQRSSGSRSTLSRLSTRAGRVAAPLRRRGSAASSRASANGSRTDDPAPTAVPDDTQQSQDNNRDRNEDESTRSEPPGQQQGAEDDSELIIDYGSGERQASEARDGGSQHQGHDGDGSQNGSAGSSAIRTVTPPARTDPTDPISSGTLLVDPGNLESSMPSTEPGAPTGNDTDEQRSNLRALLRRSPSPVPTHSPTPVRTPTPPRAASRASTNIASRAGRRVRNLFRRLGRRAGGNTIARALRNLSRRTNRRSDENLIEEEDSRAGDFTDSEERASSPLGDRPRRVHNYRDLHRRGFD